MHTFIPLALKPIQPKNEFPFLCCQCGKEELGELVREERLLKYGTCFTCDFWIEWALKDRLPGIKNNVVIVKHNHYVIVPDSESDKTFKGFGGRLFRIHFFRDPKDKVIETTNLWHQGRPPDNLIHLFPDNAVFLAEDEDSNQI